MVENSAENMQRARAAIRKGSLPEARRLLRQAVRDDPYNHAAWLLLARVTPSAEAAAEYVRRARAVSPDSPLVESARTELEEKGAIGTSVQQRPRQRTVLLLSGLVLLLVLLIGALGPLAWERVSALRDEDAVAIVAATPAPSVELPIAALAAATPTQPLLPTPTIRPTREIEAYQEEATAAAEATATTEAAEAAAAAEATAAAAAVEAAEAAEASPTTEMEEQTVAAEEEVVEPATKDDPMGLRPPGVGAAERWIDVNLTTQTLVAYEGNSAVYRTLISSGTQEYPTVVGQYRTYVKYEKQDMNGYLLGYDYYLEGVPYVMYFFGDYAIHGTYWHANFGVPMSHGCVNTSPEDAGWLFDWAPVGTTVNIHY